MLALVSRLDLRAANMAEMMLRCGVDPATLMRRQLGLRGEMAVRACIFCRRGEVCRRWLDRADRRAVGEPPGFCPNAARFRDAALNRERGPGAGVDDRRRTGVSRVPG